MEKVEKPPEEIAPDQRHEGENDSYGQIAGQGNHHSEEWEYEDLRPDCYAVPQHHVGEGFEEGAEARLHYYTVIQSLASRSVCEASQGTFAPGVFTASAG